LPQGFQDSDGGIVSGQLVTVAGYCAGQTDVPGKPATYPPGFLRRVWALDLSHPAQGWWSLPQFPGAARQELFGSVVADQLYCWGGFSYTTPYCYRDGYRLWRLNGAWRWDVLPSLPWPLCSAGICVIGPNIYVVGGGDYDANRFYTNSDRRKETPRLGARLLVLDTSRLSAGWQELPACPGTPRFVQAVAAVRGRLYMIGGASGDDNRAGRYCTVVDNWCYDPPTRQWLRLRDTPVATGNLPAGAIVFRDRYVLLVGGFQYGNVLNPDGSLRPPYGAVTKFYPQNPYNSDVLVYDAQTGAFGTADPLPLCNNLPMAVLAGDTLHLIGGETGGSIIDGEPFGHHPDLYLAGRLRILP
jgi:N-acetylneuraminic acid mutarotase